MPKRRSRPSPARGDGKSRPSRPQQARGKPPRETRDEAAPPRPRANTSAAMREIVESVVIAFVLAFLFRTFEAEAFVIPTGSMAPTLMGRHKDLICEECD